MFTKILLFLALYMTCNANRDVVKILRVGNGGESGYWRKSEYCPAGQMAVGYKMKTHSSQGSYADDSALNGIQLLCGTNYTRHNDTITSEPGPFGDWGGSFVTCNGSNFLTSFRLQVYHGVAKDNTSASYIYFRCRSLWGGDEVEIKQGEGRWGWGTFGGWSERCNKGSAICGIKTKVQSDQGEGDDTGLNDVLFHCCDDYYENRVFLG